MGAVWNRSGLLLGLVAAIGVPGAALAQDRPVELTLMGGVYVPTQDQGLEQAVRDATRRGSPIFGGRLTVWTSRSLGIEATGGLSQARVRVESAAGTFARSTELWFGSGRLVVNLTPGSSGLGLMVSGGGAVLHVGNTVPDPAASKTTAGGVVGVGARLPIGERVAVRADAEDYIYRMDFGLGRKTTQDLMLTGGLVIAF